MTELDDGAYDQPLSQHYQERISSLPRPQEATKIQADFSVTKETTSIMTRKEKNGLQVGSFLETRVPQPIVMG